MRTLAALALLLSMQSSAFAISAENRGSSSSASVATDCAIPSDRDIAAIRAASRSFSGAYVNNDMERLGLVYLPDAVIMPPNKRFVGRPSIGKYFAWKNGREQLAHSMRSEDLRICGDFLFDWGLWQSTYRQGDESVKTSEGTYFVIWKRNAERNWRIMYDMWHGAARKD